MVFSPMVSHSVMEKRQCFARSRKGSGDAEAYRRYVAQGAANPDTEIAEEWRLLNRNFLVPAYFPLIHLTQYLVASVLQKLLRQRDAELFALYGRAGDAAPHRAGTVNRSDEAGEVKLIPDNHTVGGNRHLSSA